MKANADNYWSAYIVTEYQIVTYCITVPSCTILTVLLALKYRASADLRVLAAYCGFLWLPVLSLVSITLLQSHSIGAYLGTYFLGDLLRVLVIPAAVFFAVAKKPPAALIAVWAAISTAFLGLIFPEQILRSGVIADIRTFLRFCLLWMGAVTMIVYNRRIPDRYARIIAVSYSVLSLFSIPFTFLNLITRLKTPPPFEEVFLTFNPIVFYYYLRFAGTHLLVAILFLARRSHADVDIGLFARTYGLSDREKDIVEQLLAGRSNPAIGDKLSISRFTVRNHTHRIFDKCGVKSRFELVALIRNHGAPPAGGVGSGPLKGQ